MRWNEIKRYQQFEFDDIRYNSTAKVIIPRDKYYLPLKIFCMIAHIALKLLTFVLLLIAYTISMRTKDWFAEVQIAKCGGDYQNRNIFQHFSQETEDIFNIYRAMFWILVIIFILDILYFVYDWIFEISQAIEEKNYQGHKRKQTRLYKD